jgi:hypothetical protein
MDDWWEWDKATQKVPKSNKRHFNRIAIYTIWNILKERNKRVFNNTSESTMQVPQELGRISCKASQCREGVKPI